MTRLVDRYGRTGVAAITSAIWALPMAAWAGSSDLSPIDQTAYPKVALAIGLVMLIAWFGLLVWIAKTPVAPRQRRLDLTQMSQSEKRWTLALIVFGAGLIAWLNAAATVDWSPTRSGSSRLASSDPSCSPRRWPSFSPQCWPGSRSAGASRSTRLSSGRAPAGIRPRRTTPRALPPPPGRPPPPANRIQRIARVNPAC